MTRPIAAPLLASLTAADGITAEILYLAARDGTVATFTTLDVPFEVDLGPGSASFEEGMTLSALTLTTGLDASFAEVTGALDGQLTRDAVQGGKWDGARAWLATIDPGEDGFAPLLYGRVAEPRVEGHRFILEIRNEADRFNQVVGEQLSPLCRADFGDARCKYVIPVVEATVTAVTSAMRFTVSFSSSYDDDHFNLGTATFTSGDLTGTPAADIFDWTSGGVIVLLEPLIAPPEVGDTLDLRIGCPKTRAFCTSLANMDNFRGEPSLPGSNELLRFPIPGGSEA